MKITFVSYASMIIGSYTYAVRIIDLDRFGATRVPETSWSWVLTSGL